MKYDLKTRQVCLFFIAFLPITKLFVLPSIVTGFCNEDAWLSTLLNVCLDLLTLVALLYTAKNCDTDIYGLFENSLGKVGCKILMFVYFIYFMLRAVLPLNEQRDYVEFTLYTLMPRSFYFIPFFVSAFYLCTKKLNAIGRSSDVMFFITIVGYVLLILLSLSNADFQAILPIGASGFSNVLKGSYTAMPWFGDSVYFMFFVGKFLCRKKDTLKIVVFFFIGAFMVIFFMVIFYSIFTSIAHRQRFALTEISKYTTVISNTGRFDYIGILLILLSNIFSLTMPLFFACKILDYIFGFNKNWIAPTIVISIQVIINLGFVQYFASIENVIKQYGGIFFLILSNVIPALTVFMVNKEKKIYANT